MYLPIPILLLLLTARCTSAQPSSTTSSTTNNYFNGYGSNFNAATAILIVVIVTGFFFLAFFSVYFRRCSRDRSAITPTLPGAVTASRRGARRGLDPEVIETFPTLSYSAVTKLKIGSETLECAVCLNEFGDDETLRMLPKCCHVFHPECIDTWLESHVTCPVCRDNLAESGSGSSESTAAESESVDDVAIDVDLGRMGRSHTTGHVAREVDRHRLVLPEHVMREVVAAAEGLRRSASVAVFRSGGEGSSRRGFRGLSERWTSRVMTWRRGEVEKGMGGDGSFKGGSFKGGVLNCLNGGGVSNNAGDGGASSSVDRV